MKQPRGKIIVIVAPSGTGKSTLIKKLKTEIINLSESISYTTRPMRKGEVDGVNYFFIKEKFFKEMIDEGKFIEWAQVHSNYYGTSKDFVESGLKKGLNLLFDLDVQGADKMKQIFHSDSHIIFLAPPSIEDLEHRLRKRGTDSDEVIQKRLHNARNELKRKNDYDYFIINEVFEETLLKLKEIVAKIIAI